MDPIKNIMLFTELAHVVQKKNIFVLEDYMLKNIRRLSPYSRLITLIVDGENPAVVSRAVDEYFSHVYGMRGYRRHRKKLDLTEEIVRKGLFFLQCGYTPDTMQEELKRLMISIEQEDGRAMRLCIHRGSKQIGGSCIEIESGGKSLILDAGLPLDAEDPEDFELPESLKVTKDTLGILISHYHMDHVGLLAQFEGELSYAMGKAAYSILKGAAPFLYNAFVPPPPTWDLEHKKSLSIGPFTIIPYLMDHSAFDAYAFLIEAEGRRLLYTGDFRAHGRKGRLFSTLAEEDLGPIHGLLMEGTTIGNSSGHEMKKESELEEEFAKQFQSAQGAVLVNCSSQNIDRIVTVFRAAKRTGRKLVMDLYTAEVLRGTGRKTIPQSDWEEVELYIPYRQRIHIKNNELFDQLKSHSRNRIFPEQLIEEAATKVLLFRPSFLSDRTIKDELPIGGYIYSQWKGYREDESYGRVREWLAKKQIEEYYIHTSGHAGVESLKTLAKAVKAGKVIPVHSFFPGEFENYFENVAMFPDGEWEII